MFPELLKRACAGVSGLSGSLSNSLSDAQVSSLQAHYELLVRWNQKLNLTRIEGVAEAVERHYAESLFLAVHLPPGHQRIADIGSGAGFPGLPVAIFRPDCEVTLIESHQRKSVFLREASRGLPNVGVRAKRAESIEDQFDIVISRAVSYNDLFPMIQRLAPVAYLLTGSDDPPVPPAVSIPLPWGNSRYLKVFHVKRGENT